MIFNTFAYYLLFLLPAAVLYRLTSRRVRPWICTLFGAGFYIFFSLTGLGGARGAFCVGIFFWEALFSRLYSKKSVFCIIGIVQSVAFLAIFKYWNFFTGLFSWGGAREQLHWESAFLPLGISFFTFEFIHYAADRYQGKLPKDNVADYLAFIFFFPTMVAGPIKRFGYFAPGLDQSHTKTPKQRWGDWERGITRILTGLVKKFAVADVMTAFTNHLNRDDIAVAHRWVLPLWVLAYGVKIYFDFSGYSDIAIGSTRLFGMQIPENFDWPYFRTNIAEFWRHWHMSLYRWLVDYVYIPLGGSRVVRPRIYLNIMITMLVSGIWHGAGLNFVAWGAWHGVLLCIHRLWVAATGGRSAEPSRVAMIGAWAITFVAVNLGWALFAMDIHTAGFFFYRLVHG